MSENDVVKASTKNVLAGLKGVPFLGGLAGDGVTTSGAAAGGGTVAIILALDIPTVWKAGLVTFLAACWMVSGAIKGKAPAVLLLVGLSLGTTGCGASAAPYKDALRRFQDTGKAIEPHLVPAKNDSEQALYDAFHSAINEPVR